MPKTLLHSLLFPRWLALAIDPGTAMLIAGGLGALGNFFGSKSASNAQANAQRETNALNKQLFDESRGSTGSAILPTYLKPYEADLGASAAKNAQAMFNWGGGAANQLATNDRLLSRYTPALDANDGFAIDMATGRIGDGRVSALQSVLNARTALGKSRGQAIAEGLNDTLEQLRSAKAGTGFRGLSTFDINRSQLATIGARTQALEAQRQAELENALASQALYDSNLNMRLGAIDLPYKLGQERINFNALPSSALAQFYGNAMAPLSFFRLPTAQAPTQTVLPTASNTQLGGAAMAGLGNTLGQYFAQQQLMNTLASIYGGGGRGGIGGAPVNVPLGTS